VIPPLAQSTVFIELIDLLEPEDHPHLTKELLYPAMRRSKAWPVFVVHRLRKLSVETDC
jgi:hypothetical protein